MTGVMRCFALGLTLLACLGCASILGPFAGPTQDEPVPAAATVAGAEWLGRGTRAAGRAPPAESGTASAPGAGSDMHGSPASSQETGGATLRAEVQVLGLGGPPPPPGLQVPGPARMPAPAGTLVQVTPPDSPAHLLAEQAIDARGQATFQLPPGCYWVIVPWRDQMEGIPPGVARGDYLPDGQLVHAWAEATLTEGTTTEAVLSIMIALP
jgi:hypothetical protein